LELFIEPPIRRIWPVGRITAFAYIRGLNPSCLSVFETANGGFAENPWNSSTVLSAVKGIPGSSPGVGR
jgi:hypothetical protein